MRKFSCCYSFKQFLDYDFRYRTRNSHIEFYFRLEVLMEFVNSISIYRRTVLESYFPDLAKDLYVLPQTDSLSHIQRSDRQNFEMSILGTGLYLMDRTIAHASI